jgi:hypothetical protein
MTEQPTAKQAINRQKSETTRSLIMIGGRHSRQGAILPQTITRLLCGQSVAFPGCKDPGALIEKLGIACQAELMTVRKESGEVVETGYLIAYKGE